MKKNQPNSPKITIHRSSVDGRFITETEAKRNPRESETERIRRVPQRRPGR
jgi:hypothetical protein